MGEPTPNNGGESDGGDEPWEIQRQNILGKQTASVPDLCQKASVAEAQGAPGEVDTDKGDGQGTPASHWPARQWSGVEILNLRVTGGKVLKGAEQGRDWH